MNKDIREVVGGARYVGKKLAERITKNSAHHFCWMMDDNIAFFKGVTLKNDPIGKELFGREPSQVKLT